MTVLDRPRRHRPALPRPRLRDLAPEPRSTTGAMVAWAAGALSVVIVWAVVYGLWLSALTQHHDQDVLYAQFRQQVAEATAPIGGAIEPGRPVGVMSMPSVGLRDEVIVEGTAADQLTSGPGHRRDTPLPGQAGVSLVYGRATLFGGPFGDIARARAGDTITVRTGEGLAKYVVDGVRRQGDPFPATLAAGAGRLTLVTAEDSALTTGRTLFVDASLASKPFGTPSGRPAAVPTYETAMQSDSAALFPLVLWLALLLGAVVAGVWAQTRWGRRQTWLVAVPVVLAALWGATETAVQLLPNLM